MSRKMLVLLTAGIVGLSSTLSCAVGGKGGTPGAIPAMSEGIAHGKVSPTVKMPAADGYLIGSGDVLDISVWKDDALTRSCVVRPDGFISFPLIGEIPAAGRTALKLKAEMEAKLNRYVP